MNWRIPSLTCNARLLAAFDTSNHLSENAPHMQFSTFFWTRLQMEPSITPHADEVEIHQLFQAA